MAAVSKATVSRQPLPNFCAGINHKPLVLHTSSHALVKPCGQAICFYTKKKGGFPFTSFNRCQAVINMTPANLKGKPPGTMFSGEVSNTGSSRSFHFFAYRTALIRASFCLFCFSHRFNKLMSDSLHSCAMIFFLPKDTRQFHA